MSEQTDLHNMLAGQIVRAIVKPPIEAGGEFSDVLVLLESVVAGVLVVCTKAGGDEIVLQQLYQGVKARMPDLRLGMTEPEGSA